MSWFLTAHSSFGNQFIVRLYLFIYFSFLTQQTWHIGRGIPVIVDSKCFPSSLLIFSSP
ncbi:hypothetical protein CPB83DRAFT_862698 [Crepidotus variabilis]|uniref:Uncharacterized protein n=1 Tax=Crepidotus variabilis TaxID=179855 RepID=A0A9P6E6Q3_9AGAR|nr:hypothetical protein CPB83DRAFT_862698 [Crepidotus variabilis]